MYFICLKCGIFATEMTAHSRALGVRIIAGLLSIRRGSLGTVPQVSLIVYQLTLAKEVFIKLHERKPSNGPSDTLVLSTFTCIRWTCIGWPYKIQLQMEATEASLDADEERFQKNLLADQNTFQDRLDSLNMAVAGFAAHTDISKAHEVANEVRRLTKQLKECQALANTYNNRERLFGLPVTSVSCLIRL